MSTSPKRADIVDLTDSDSRRKSLSPVNTSRRTPDLLLDAAGLQVLAQLLEQRQADKVAADLALKLAAQTKARVARRDRLLAAKAIIEARLATCFKFLLWLLKWSSLLVLGIGIGIVYIQMAQQAQQSRSAARLFTVNFNTNCTGDACAGNADSNPIDDIGTLSDWFKQYLINDAPLTPLLHDWWASVSSSINHVAVFIGY